MMMTLVFSRVAPADSTLASTPCHRFCISSSRVAVDFAPPLPVLAFPTSWPHRVIQDRSVSRFQKSQTLAPKTPSSRARVVACRLHLVCCLFLQIKLYWKAATPIHPPVVCGRFCVTMAELSRRGRAVWPTKPKIFVVCSFGDKAKPSGTSEGARWILFCFGGWGSWGSAELPEGSGRWQRR